jgi:hypothetical protein
MAIWTPEYIQMKLVEARAEFIRAMQVQGQFWCPLCDKWHDEKKMYQIVGHAPPDRLVVFGLCEPCTRKADPNYVGAVQEALNERAKTVTIEKVESRMKFLLKDRILAGERRPNHRTS